MKEIKDFYSEKIEGNKVFGGEGRWLDTETTTTKDPKTGGTFTRSDSYFDSNENKKFDDGEKLDVCITFTPA
ncbi:hypothetical protein D3C87_679700 [compost metagenome]